MVAQKVLVYVLSNTLVLLHPFMPFITEEIWQHLPHEGETIMRTNWPEFKSELVFDKEEKEMEIIMAAIKAIRNTRASMNVPPSKKAELFVKTELTDIFQNGTTFFIKLASASDVVMIKNESELPENTVNIVSEGAVMYIPLGELIDVEKERERLLKEKGRLEAEVKRVEGKLSNQGFVSKAPAKLIEEEKEKGEKYRQMLEKVIESLNNL